ncbi:selenium-dependent molybdenum cofactor biosynthesis protein YqeB [Natroniella sulfidigena]|uniref:selenium-dependent molybdenum cofactor biosynthesis protein YqeB n=1 Tax=Natroniella sulfidigena TaxID=723921 RepID=UPI00200AFD3A|nr:selenium-dependent molybdenum cofactor biosynthesis protein YqeB [Natroniella sulfidigena]MCK8817582.1 selenium-dependent molybdenum cofactor biosynthesis protein YqeB [Natroniella sulfidigena]
MVGSKKRVVVRGAGDLATGVIYNLYQAGFEVVATEIAEPLVVRRTVSFAQAVYEEQVEVEGVVAKKVEDFEQIEEEISNHRVPIIVDPLGDVIDFFKPQVVVDAIMAKKNLGTEIDDAPIVIGLGPGFEAGKDVDAVIETERGHDLGRVIYQGQAKPNTGVPGDVAGYTNERVLKSPTDGQFESACEIGDPIQTGEVIGYVEEEKVVAEISGIIRGLLKSDVKVKAGTKLGDIDPRKRVKNCYTISDKARTIGGAVVVATLAMDNS